MDEIANVDAALSEIDRGRTEAFALVVRTYGLPLRSYLASHVHHLDDVDDLAQEVFLTAFRNLASYRRGEDFGAWLRGIARNKLLNYFRSTARRGQALRRWREEVARTVEGDLERAAAADRAEVIERLLRCIAGLPDRLRRVVRAGLEGSKPVELAEAMCTTVGAVYNLHYRANQLLRECLQKEAE
jgi:RNA polymerase sigma-70 factor (ECF subfamily)